MSLGDSQAILVLRRLQRIAAPLCYTATLVACAGIAGAAGSADTAAARVMPPAGAVVRTGADMLARDRFAAIRGLRVGLLTNHTGTVVTDRGVRSTIDVLHESDDVDLVALFSPEHGIRGDVLAGVRIDSNRDAATGLPVHSLYGATRTPTPEMLRDIDALVVDIQDVGARYYTYVWSMTLAMKAAAENNVRMVVLDRPNVVGGTHVQGSMLDTAFATFVGLYPVPMRYGLTVGELARYINAEYRIGANLTVIPMTGWTRTMWFDDTGLPWKAPSPNMPTVESAGHYPGTCLFEGVNISVGRGTPAAYQQIGAPWLDNARIAERLRAYALPGVRIETTTFTPDKPGDGSYASVRVNGLRYTITDRATYDPARTAIATLVEIHKLHADSLQFRVSHFDRLAGSADIRTQILAGASMAQITAAWDAHNTAFRAKTQPYLLYF